MAKQRIRTDYIKSLINDKEELSRMLEESTKNSLDYLLDESLNRSIRQVLAESEDDFKEEEVDPKEEMSFEGGSKDSGSFDDADNGSAGTDGMGGDSLMTGDDNGNEKVWDSLEQYKDSDGEYDLRGQDIDKVFDILQQLDPNDKENGVRIVKTSDFDKGICTGRLLQEYIRFCLIGKNCKIIESAA